MAELRSKIMLMKQLEELQANPNNIFSAGLKDDSDIYNWEIVIMGPPDTIFEGGVFNAVLSFPIEYPLRPPTMKFLSNMWHPNIYADGTVCISILQDSRDFAWGNYRAGECWLPVHTVQTILLSVVSLLSDPNVTSPANLQAAREFTQNYSEYKKKVSQCVRKSQE
ncbi:probable ubiquitin-conjugating enzyme E2 7 [Teleopsis dalmanni]|uniref:probable ubiquitin-conjugating enzyme E2 7 n=1 Tax=Teleopsis dalmanni TaxID=139649 RepID=UPI0018CE7E67|nr:probable ubiquitin-conjugating enzyme E2 7 [Teleopsis dalmanni]